MPDFIGRRQELDLLENAWKEERSAFIPIYGRRRVGKSELILHFLDRSEGARAGASEKQGIYFVGKQAPAGLQIREFLDEAAVALDDPHLSSLSTEAWGPVLDAVVARRRPGSKLVFAFDEFQWMAAASPELPSLLQERWDRQWKSSGDVFLILCGSYIGFMEREVLGRSSPLFGRRTAQIQLRPFGYREAAEFHPGYGLVDRARTYFLCGGVPYYLRFFSDRVSVETNIARQLLTEHAPLFREGDFLLREELREVENYFAVLTAIAAGHASNRRIADATGLDARQLPYYLKQLGELGYLRRRHPLTGANSASRQVRWDLDDPLLRFWFRFVFPHTSYILHRGPERALADRVRPHLDAYFGLCFERLCREALPDLYLREGIHAAFEIGEYWSKTSQIDVVGSRDDGWIDLGECKWGAVRSPRAVEDELERKVADYPNPRNATLGRRVFTRRVSTPKVRAAAPRSAAVVKWHGLEDLYAEPD